LPVGSAEPTGGIYSDALKFEDLKAGDGRSAVPYLLVFETKPKK
jgi:hypothetical protein